MDEILERHDFKAGLGFRLTRAATILQSAVDKALAPLGLTRLSWIVLAAIHFDERSSVTAVAGYVGMERSAVSRLVSRLEDAGLVRREKSLEDGRATRLEATEQGRRLCERVPDIIQNATAQHLADLSPNQIVEMGTLLDRIQSGEALAWFG